VRRLLHPLHRTRLNLIRISLSSLPPSFALPQFVKNKFSFFFVCMLFDSAGIGKNERGGAGSPPHCIDL